jgi:hypothetical protein
MPTTLSHLQLQQRTSSPRHFNSEQSRPQQSAFQQMTNDNLLPKSKMAVLAASTNPTTVLTTTQNTKTLLALLSPAFANSLCLATILQRLLSTTTLFLLFRSYLLSIFLLQQSYHASQILLIQSLYASSIACKNAYWASKKGTRLLWRSTEGMRKKLFMEFMIFVLGGGNQLILVLFWPGWIIVVGGIWGVWSLCG